MSNKVIQPLLVKIALDLMPSRIRHTILDDRTFLGQWNFPLTVGVTLGKNGPSFRRDQLFDGMRRAIRELGAVISIQDESRGVWELMAQPQGETLAFFIRANDICYSVMDHSALAENASVRVKWFEKTAKYIGFENNNYQEWVRRLHQSPLSDDEFAKLMSDVRHTPVNIYRALCSSMGNEETADVAVLVPEKPCYYERLVGKLGSTTTVAEYIDAGVRPLVTDLLCWNNKEGFLGALLMCSTGPIAEIIQIKGFVREELIKSFQWLRDYGDPISRVGAVEVALSHLETHPELAPFVEEFVEGFLADNPESDSGDFALLSAMIIMVASELIRRRTLGKAPPFYRRQAAIAQASLVVRAIKESGIDPASVTQWAKNSGVGHIFAMQGLIDLRYEPRWLPDFINASQLRAEFIGRIVNAASRNYEKIKIESLQALLVGASSKLSSAVQWPLPMLPGPLEGAIAPERPIPQDQLDGITAALEANSLGINSFAGLINAALLFDFPPSQSDLAATALRRVNFSIEDADDERKIFDFVGGLAVVAAVTRSANLADTLRILTRVLRRRTRLNIEPGGEMRIAMIAAASFENLEDWARFAGEWMKEIAFGSEDKDSAEYIRLKLRRMVQIEPALARHCAAAEAALAAFAH